MVRLIVIKLMERFARLTKGTEYRVDPDMPLSSLFGVGKRRFCDLMRCIFRGIRVSADVRKLVYVGPGVELRNRRKITFGRGVTLGKNVIIDGLSREGVVIEDSVVIGPYSIIEASGVIGNIGQGLRIGANSGVGAFSFIGAAGGVWIGRNVIMGQRVSFHSENHKFDRIDIPIRLQGVSRQGITIEDDCWVGANVTFLDGAHVGRGCVIGAGSVVKGTIPPYSVIAGAPAKVLRSRGNGAA